MLDKPKDIKPWLASMPNKELRILKINVDSEVSARAANNGRRIYPKTIEMLEDLHEFPPKEVARLYMVSRQYTYYLCKKYNISPVKDRKRSHQG